MNERLRRLWDFLTEDLWRVPLHELTPLRAMFYRGLRVAIMAGRGFNEDQCLLRAPALTFYVLLSIVPVFAMAFGVAKGFGLERFVTQALEEALPEQLNQTVGNGVNIVASIQDYADNLLSHARGGVVAGVGFLVLLYSVYQVFENIEGSFNAIYGVSRSRGVKRKFSDYFSLMLIAPALMALSGSLSVMVSQVIQTAGAKAGLSDYISPVLYVLLRSVSIGSTWLLFGFMYVFVPNTKVRLRSAFVAAVLAGTVYLVVQWAFFHFHIGISRLNAIYGGLMAAPLFLIWVHLSWLIVLFGAELCFAHQNVDNYEHETDSQDASHEVKRRLAVAVTRECARRFDAARPAPTDVELARALGLPIRLTRVLTEELVQAGVLTEIARGERDNASFQPAFDTDKMTLREVWRRYERRGECPSYAEGDRLEGIGRAFEALDRRLAEAPENVRLTDV